ncbi:protein translocase subunit SecD [Rhizohabitans arisaemae]|uniref:protein translocase subunit SecD n=1 Tax=Rhizohabitans arisaemae TaxID=2720610 RepID=UPI0024B1B426|nr:protein translocase subunit SecD [Rhizohabitans arisaemae]
MSRALVVRAFFTLAVIGLSFYFVFTSAPRLGLDLKGGTQIVLETRDSPTTKANGESTDRAKEVLTRRVDALGVAEPSVVRSGEKRIIVELPGLQDPRKAAEVIGKTAQLTFHPVTAFADESTKPGKGETVFTDVNGEKLLLGPSAITGEQVSGASAGLDQTPGTNAWVVTIDFKGPGQRAWSKLTGTAACAPMNDPKRLVAIVLDNKIISSPQVNPDVNCNVGIVGGSTQITGDFTAEESKELAALISGGALPVPVEIIEQRTVGPTLGVQAIDASFKAAIIGVVLTGLFIIIVYRLSGLMAAIALCFYGLISYAALVAIGATLTLPGLAGFVLAIGMAVDANVLVFERAREEYAGNRSLTKALRGGFRNAWSAIADSNITTILAAGLLFFLASGPVRGFGVTLIIGVLASLVSAMLITRVFTEFMVSRKAVGNKPQITGIADIGRVRAWLTRKNFNLMKRRRMWLAVSGIAVILALTGIGARGLDIGVEFTGGRLIEYATSKQLDVETARKAVADAGFPRAVVQTSNGSDISVRTGQLTNDEAVRIEQALAAEGGKVVKQRDELIGPSLGDELRRNALIALAVALAAQLLYLTVRFRWSLALGAVLAMFHDVLIVTGVFAWLGKPVDGVFLAAILTVIGYSVNDSVVVFDRIREMWGANRADPLPAIANSAILQTVPRTINTGLGALFILTALAVLGGDSLTDFAVALIVGILIGTWSSMFTATPLALEFEKYSKAPPPMPPGGKSKRPVDRRDSGAVV